MDIVITTIFPPTDAMRALAAGLHKRHGRLWVIGDKRGPDHYPLPAARFHSLKAQLQLPYTLAPLLPEGHYARKNLGYLLAIHSGAPHIVETDDDNTPLPAFWQPRTKDITARLHPPANWVNIYRHYSRERIWPRGIPLEQLQNTFTTPADLHHPIQMECLIQQGLANDNPDVDAIYRLTGKLPVKFAKTPPIALPPNTWCPFNSQNTTFFPPAYPLLYLPVHCTFRMTDIWRSFIAQRCLWEMDTTLAFTTATVSQDRNEHNLLRDFADEVPGYLQNENIRQTLQNLKLRRGRKHETVTTNLHHCYTALITAGILPKAELPLLEAWIHDLPPSPPLPTPHPPTPK